MKLHVLSDLHQEFSAYSPPAKDCDVVVLAGDINLKLHGLRWALDSFPGRPVLYVFGNHEFYGEKWPRLVEKGRELVAGSNVRILENEACEIGGWRFFGATLWSDFMLTGDLSGACEASQRVMTDFKRIRHWPSFRKWVPMHARQAHAASRSALVRFLETGDRARSVVVTHHAPSVESLPAPLRDDPVSSAYASRMEHMMETSGPRLWIHGHIHHPSSYWVGKTQVVANPRGYPGETGFRDGLVIEV